MGSEAGADAGAAGALGTADAPAVLAALAVVAAPTVSVVPGGAGAFVVATAAASGASLAGVPLEGSQPGTQKIEASTAAL